MNLSKLGHRTVSLFVVFALLFSSCSMTPNVQNQDTQILNRQDAQQLVSDTREQGYIKNVEAVLQKDGLALNWENTFATTSQSGQMLTVFSSDKNKFVRVSFKDSTIISASLIQVRDTSETHFSQTETDLLKNTVFTATANLTTKSIVSIQSGYVQSTTTLKGLSTSKARLYLQACNVPDSLTFNLTAAYAGYAAASIALTAATVAFAGCAAIVLCPAIAATWAGANAAWYSAYYWVLSARAGISEWKSANC